MLPDNDLATPRKPGILVVDDNEDVRDVLDAALRHVGFAVWTAADGREALELYRRHHEAIALVLLDICMPHLNGPQTWAVLQETDARVCCCFMSGHMDGYTVEQLRDLGAADVFVKPFHPTEIAQALSALIRDHQPVAEETFEVMITETIENMETERDDVARSPRDRGTACGDSA